MIVILTSFFIISVIGFIAQHIGICMIKGVGKAIDGDPALLLAIFLTGCWLWIYFLVSSHLGWQNNIPRYAFHPIFLLGGFIYGIGAGVNQACSVSTMNRLNMGDLSMVMTMIGWAIGWCLWVFVSMQFNWHIEFYKNEQHFSNRTIVLLFIPALIILIQRLIFKPEQRALWLGVLVFGLLATMLFLLESGWPPSRLIQDSGVAIFDPATGRWPDTQRYLLLMGLCIGMWFAAYRAQKFRLKMISLKRVSRYLPAGILMGFGGAMALGGNDSHLLMGLPTLSFASLAAVIGMLSGIAVERMVYRRFFSKSINNIV